MKKYLTEVKQLQKLAGLIKEDISEGYSDTGVQELYPLMDELSSLISTNSNLSTADKEAMLPILKQIQSIVDTVVGDDEDDDYEEPVSDYGRRRQQDDRGYYGLEEKEKPGLWANIRAKRAKGEAPAKKGSKAYKSAVKAAKEINKNK